MAYAPTVNTPQMPSESAQTLVLEFGMGVDVHGQDCTKAARRAVFDALRHSSLPLLGEIRKRDGTMLVDVTVAVRTRPQSISRRSRASCHTAR